MRASVFGDKWDNGVLYGITTVKKRENQGGWGKEEMLDCEVGIHFSFCKRKSEGKPTAFCKE